MEGYPKFGSAREGTPLVKIQLLHAHLIRLEAAKDVPGQEVPLLRNVPSRLPPLADPGGRAFRAISPKA